MNLGFSFLPKFPFHTPWFFKDLRSYPCLLLHCSPHLLKICQGFPPASRWFSSFKRMGSILNFFLFVYISILEIFWKLHLSSTTSSGLHLSTIIRPKVSVLLIEVYSISWRYTVFLQKSMEHNMVAWHINTRVYVCVNYLLKLLLAYWCRIFAFTFIVYFNKSSKGKSNRWLSFLISPQIKSGERDHCNKAKLFSCLQFSKFVLCCYSLL